MGVVQESGRGFNDASSVSSLALGSQSPNANSLFLFIVLSKITSGTPAAPGVTSGFAGTWTSIADFAYQTTAANDTRITVWANLIPASPGSGVVTADWSGVTQTAAHVRGMTFTGQAVGGSNGSDAIGPTGTATGTNTSGSVTLAAPRTTGSLHFGVVAHNVASEAFTPGSGFTADSANNGAPVPVFSTEWKNNAPTISASWPTSSAYGIVGIELMEASSHPVPVVVDFAVDRAANL